MKYLKGIGQTDDKDITQTDSKVTIDGFLEVLKAQVLVISNNLVANYPELKPLFNAINSNDILKININDLNKLLTNKQFEWKGNRFGLISFDAEKAPYSVTDWYYLTANLTLDFTCLDENAKVNTSTINQSYDMYFANDGSNLDKVVNVVTANIEEKLKAIKVVNIEYDKWDDSFVNQESKVLSDINNQLKANTELSTIKDLEIKTQTMDNPYNNDYCYMNKYGIMNTDDFQDDPADSFPLTLPRAQNFIKNYTDFNNAWKTIIDNRENNFISRLQTWETNNHLTIGDKDKVFVFGEYRTIDWKISGLEIKPLSLPYYITNTSTTRLNNINNSLAILEKLFVGTDALFQFDKNYTFLGTNSGVFDVKLNFDIYDDFISRDAKVQEVYDYISNQTKNFGTNHKFIKDTDKVQWISNNTSWLNVPISNSYLLRSNYQYYDRNFRLVINGYVFAMSGNKNGFIYFKIIRSGTNVWPTS